MHASETNIITTKRRISPLFGCEARQLKSKGRAAEKKWLRNKTPANKGKYKLINKAYQGQLHDNKTNI